MRFDTRGRFPPATIEVSSARTNKNGDMSIDRNHALTRAPPFRFVRKSDEVDSMQFRQGLPHDFGWCLDGEHMHLVAATSPVPTPLDDFFGENYVKCINKTSVGEDQREVWLVR